MNKPLGPIPHMGRRVTPTPWAPPPPGLGGGGGGPPPPHSSGFQERFCPSGCSIRTRGISSANTSSDEPRDCQPHEPQKRAEQSESRVVVTKQQIDDEPKERQNHPWSECRQRNFECRLFVSIAVHLSVSDVAHHDQCPHEENKSNRNRGYRDKSIDHRIAHHENREGRKCQGH